MIQLHMSAGALDADAPEVWACPRLSEYGAGWLIDWYDAKGSKQGVTVAKGAALAWLCENPEAIASMQAEVQTWLKGLGR